MSKTPPETVLAKPARIKMSDIAKLAGVATSTVSRALSGHPSIPQSLREEITALALSQGYVVNQAAQSLRLQRTRVISVIVPLGHERGQLISDPFFLEMIGRLADEITGREYEMLIKKVVAPRPGWLTRIIQSQRADGLLVIGQSDQHQALNQAADIYRPLVVWGGAIAGSRYCTVGTDNIAGARMAVEHLVGLGRRRIAFLGPPGAPEADQRREGYVQALAQAGLKPYPELSAPAHFTVETAQSTIQALIASGVRFDAVFAASDLIAITAIQALKAAGRAVPDDVSVVGFDDIALARHGAPALTTIRQELATGAQAMVELLFQRIAGEETSSMLMAPSLVVRDS